MLIVPAKPFDTIKGKEKLVDAPYQGAGNTIFFTLGRYALLYVLEHFGIEPTDKVLCPAYCCKSAIEPMISHGFNIEFIDITKELGIDAQVLIQQIEKNNIKAVILPEYFGLFDTISDTIYMECNKRNVIVIKDSAHSYLSYLYNREKHFYDAVVLSMRKSVNIQYGGAAFLPGEIIIDKHILRKSLLHIKKFEFIKWAESIAVRAGINIYGKLVTNAKNLFSNAPSSEITKVVITGDHVIRGLEARYLLNRNYYSSEVASIRRKNFLKLNHMLKTSGITSPFSILNDDKVPQVYLVYGGIALCTFLRNRGVGATMWPFQDVPNEVIKEIASYPNTGHFLKNLVCLPVHQGLSEKHLKKISELIHTYAENKQ